MNRRWLAPLTMLVLCTASASTLLAVDGDDQGIRMSLGEAQRAALQNNLDLVIARKDPRIAALNVDFQKAVFDPEIGASVNHAEAKDEPSQVFQSTRSKSDTVGLSWTDRLTFGGEYSLTLGSRKLDAPNPFRSYNPSYDSSLAMTFSMPLLRGLGTTVNTSDIVIARRNLEISDEELRRQAIATIKSVEDAYWDLVAVRAALDVAQQSLKLAQDLLDLNKKKVEVGTLAPIEITQAEAGVASREEGVIVADTALQSAEDNLRRLLAIPSADPTWDKRLVPTDEPTFAARTPDLQAAIAKALEIRPELVASRRDLENRKLSERVAENLVKPGLQFDAAITPSGNNLKGVLVDPGPDGITGTDDDLFVPDTGGLGESLSEVPKFRNYNWSVGLTYSIPLFNRAAKAGYGTAILEREKAELAVQNAEQTVRVDVRNAVRAVESGVKRVAAAHSSTILQRKKLEAEQKKFDNGMSTSFEVLTFQNDLQDAQLSEIRALLDYQKGLADLERAQGTLLEARGLKLETGR